MTRVETACSQLPSLNQVWCYEFATSELKLPITCNVFVMMKHFTVINQQKSQTCCVYLNMQKFRLLAFRVSSEKF